MRNSQEFLEMLLPHRRAPHPAGNSFSKRWMGQRSFRSKKRRGKKDVELSNVPLKSWKIPRFPFQGASRGNQEVSRPGIHFYPEFSTLKSLFSGKLGDLEDLGLF